MNNLKLFVWEKALCDYSDGIMFALAENVDKAKEYILELDDYPKVREELEKQPKIYESPIAYVIWGGG